MQPSGKSCEEHSVMRNYILYVSGSISWSVGRWSVPKCVIMSRPRLGLVTRGYLFCLSDELLIIAFHFSVCHSLTNYLVEM